MARIRNDGAEYLPLADATELLRGGLARTFHDAIHHGWSAWKQAHPALLALPSRTLRATAVHEVAVARLSLLLEGHPRVIVVPPVEGRRRAHFVIKDRSNRPRMVVQTKKLGPGLLTRNIPTAEAKDFDAQRKIDGLLVGPRVTLGYSVLADGTDIVTRAVYRIGSRIAWTFDLDDGRAVEQLRLPEQPPATKKKPRVTGKPGAAKRLKEGTDKGK